MSLGREYTLRYNVDAGNALRDLFDIQRALLRVHYSGGEAAKGVAAFEASLNTLNARAAVTGTSFQAVQRSVDKTRESFLGLDAGLAKSLAGFAALGAAAEVLSDIKERTSEVVDYMAKMGDKAADVRQEFRELATLQGKDAPTNQQMAEVSAFGLRVGMTPKQAVEFMNQFEGSAPAGLQKGNVTRETLESLKVDAARIGQRINLNTGTSGDLAGIMGQLGKIPDADRGAQMMGQIVYGLSEGRGKNLESLMSAYLNLAAGMVQEDGGQIDDPAKLAALHGVYSTMHMPKEAATYMRIAAKEMREMRGGQGEALAELGVDPNMGFDTALEHVFNYLDRQKAEGVTPEVALVDGLGFTRDRGVRAITELYINRDVVKARYQNSRNITAQQVRAQNDAYFRSLAGRKNLLDAQTGTADVQFGQQFEPLQMARQAATMRMRQTGSFSSNELAWLDQVHDGAGLAQLFGTQEALGRRVDKEVMGAINAEIVRLGVQEDPQYRAFADQYRASDGGVQALAAFIKNVEPLVTAKGGDFTGGAGFLPNQIRNATTGTDTLPTSIAGREPMGRAEAWARRLFRGLGGVGHAVPTYGPGLHDTITPTDIQRQMLAENERTRAGIPEGMAKVLEVIDGDTLKVMLPDGQAQTVRMLGVNTPETKHPTKGVEPFGPEASAYTKLALEGQNVRLQASRKGDDVDKYGRQLRYVFTDQGTNFNEQLLRLGLGETMSFDHDLKGPFDEAQQEAKTKGRNKWESLPTKPPGAGGGAAWGPGVPGKTPWEQDGEQAMLPGDMTPAQRRLLTARLSRPLPHATPEYLQSELANADAIVNAWDQEHAAKVGEQQGTGNSDQMITILAKIEENTRNTDRRMARTGGADFPDIIGTGPRRA